MYQLVSHNFFLRINKLKKSFKIWEILLKLSISKMPPSIFFYHKKKIVFYFFERESFQKQLSVWYTKLKKKKNNNKILYFMCFEFLLILAY